jgi:hypothetical protein
VNLPQPSALESLDAFYLEHRLCDHLDGGTFDGAHGKQADRVWLACTACEVRIEVRLGKGKSKGDRTRTC